MAATREKEAKGEELDEMDYSLYVPLSPCKPRADLTEDSNEKVNPHGGLADHGRPTEAVRENIRAFPLTSGTDDLSSSKRALSDDEMEDDSVSRSMARRRKSSKAGEVVHVCRDCKKVFKRPCDLTKHEKTHSRPWKCSAKNCKYHQLGWPTEKERDRHVNDKHSAVPPQYKCHY